MRATISSMWVKAAIRSDHWLQRYCFFTFISRDGKSLLLFCAGGFLVERRGGHGQQKIWYDMVVTQSIYA
jgi:hypothetical protein